MYAKVFRSLWDGTLADSWETWSTFVFLLAHADLDGTVEMTTGAIARRSCIPLEKVEAAIAALQCPDPASRSDAEDGRRLIPLDDRGWGWQIVNYLHYRKLVDGEMVRKQTKIRVSKHREKKRSVTVGNGQKRYVEGEVEGEVEVEAKEESKAMRASRFQRPTTAEIQAYFAELQKPLLEAERFENYYTANGWRVGRNPMKDWKATARNWKVDAQQGGSRSGKMTAAQVLAFSQHLKAQGMEK